VAALATWGLPERRGRALEEATEGLVSTPRVRHSDVP
jgi:hypothetical protein